MPTQQDTAMAGLLQQNPEAMSKFLQSRLIPQSVGGTEKPETTVGKINYDVRTGNITPDTGESLKNAELKRDSLSMGKAEGDLRQEFNRNLSGITTALTSLGNARALIEGGNPYEAQAALTAFVRAIDNSVVRPSEQAQYQNINGIAVGLENRLGQLLGKGPFGEESKKQILDAIDTLAKTSEEVRSGAVNFYSRIAERSGLDPYNVTGFTFAPVKKGAQEPPTIGKPLPPPVSGPPQRHIE